MLNVNRVGLSWVVAIVFTNAVSIGVTHAGMLYVANHDFDESTRIANVVEYAVTGDQLAYSGVVPVVAQGYGMIDMAIDPCEGIAFVSHEGGWDPFEDEWVGTEGISVVDLANKREISVCDVNAIIQLNVTGLAYDVARHKVYGTQRDSNLLFVMNWDPYALELKLEKVVALSGIRFACGVEVDGNTLYVSEYMYVTLIDWPYDPWPDYYTVRRYDISHDFASIDKVDVESLTIGIAVDGATHTLYAGQYSSYDCFLAKKSLSPAGAIIAKNLGFNIYGLATDAATPGRVFAVTTHYDGDVEIWDTAGWTSDPNQIISPTASTTEGLYGPAGVAYIGTSYVPRRLKLTGDDGVASVDIDTQFTYTVTVEPNSYSHQSVTLELKLPRGVNKISSPDGGTYDPIVHSYTWTFGPLSSGSVQRHLVVQVNDFAEPAANLVAYAVAWSNDNSFRSHARIITPVASVASSSRIYVRADAAGGGSGRSWPTAYNDLQLALARARRGCGNTIWVAKGLYRPGPIPTAVFDIPTGVSVYGSLAGNEPSDCNLAARDFRTNRTVLTGEITPGAILPDFEHHHQVTSDLRNFDVITMGNGTLLDGCVVEKAMKYGVNVGSGTVAIRRCSIADNGEIGVAADASDCSITIDRCVVEDNGQDGIKGSYGGPLTVTASVIRNNMYNGIDTSGASTVTIKDSVISHNGLATTWPYIPRYYGIKLYGATAATVANCTIAYNIDTGLYREAGGTPSVRNCILWYNMKWLEPYGPQTVGIPGANITYSCMTDTVVPDSASNIHVQPGFASLDPNYADYFHLAAGSPCIDKGDPCTARYLANEKDIDGDARVYYGTADIGADEQVCTESIFNVADFNGDGIVDMFDFAIMGKAWRSHDPQDPAFIQEPDLCALYNLAGWNRYCNLSSDYVIDMKDLGAFSDSWLWRACWYKGKITTEHVEGLDPNEPNEPYYDPNEPFDPNMPEDPNDPNFPEWNMESMQGGGSLEMDMAQVSNPAAEIQQFQENIDWLYQAAAETPEAAVDMYEFIRTLEQELSDIYGTLPGYDFTQ